MNTIQSLVVFTMSHRRDWDSGTVNRNYHVLKTVQSKKTFQKIVAIDFLPFTKKKKLKVLLKGRPWLRNSQTVFWRWHTRVDRDAEDPNLYWMTSLDCRSLNAVLKKLHISEEGRVVWSYNPFATHIVNALPKALSVFDAVDNWSEHSSYSAFRTELEDCYANIQKTADVIFTVSEGLVDFLGKQENVFFIPNGVDTDHFAIQEGDISLLRLPAKQRRKPTAIIGYHGIIQPRVNLSIVEYVAKKHPEYDFVLVGPVWKEMRKEVDVLSKMPNVFFPGVVPYSALPKVINCFDVAIIPHRIDRFTHSMNPLKLYEYLAAGKPIVSTPVAGSDQFQDLVQLAISPEDFSTGITQALASDTPELRSRRLHMASQHRWQQRVEMMLSIVERAMVKK